MLRIFSLIIMGSLFVSSSVGIVCGKRLSKRIGFLIAAILYGIVFYYIWIT